MKENPNKILTIHENEISTIIFKSLILKDININIREYVNRINKSDFIKMTIIVLNE